MINNSLVFTIVTPSFNQGEFIADTLSSAISQRGNFYIDYVVMDGASKDNTVEVLQAAESFLKNNYQTIAHGDLQFFLPNDQVAVDQPYKINCLGVSFRYASEPDKGQYDAVNKGQRAGKGDVFSYLNSDDVLEPGALQTVSFYLAHYPDVGVVYGNAYYTNKEGQISGLYPTRILKGNSLLENCHISQPSGFTRYSAVRQVGEYNSKFRFAGDYEYWVRMHFAGIKFLPVREVLSSTRVYPATKTNTGKVKFALETLALVFHYSKGKISHTWTRDYARELSVWGRALGRVARIAVQVRKLLTAPIALWYRVRWTSDIKEMEKKLFTA